jgi:hypothetical protein
MPRYEYKVVPAPKKGEKARGVKTSEDRFAHALNTLMNQLGADGWEYLRADSLPAEERSGFTGRTTVVQNLLIFRRTLDAAVGEVARPADPRVVQTPRPSLVAAADPAVVAVRRDPTEGPTPRLGPARGSVGD